jgi:uncharacterized repeat protein (TIGR01451 family)
VSGHPTAARTRDGGLRRGARIFALALLLCGICSSPAFAAPAGYSLFYVPADETNMAIVLSESQAGTVDNVGGITKPMRSIIGITSWTDGTKVYIDHWEDGYEMDLGNPDATADEIIPVMNGGDQRTLLSTMVPSLLTERSDPSDATPTDCLCTTCTPGVTPQTGSPAGFATNCFYDGKDKIYAVGGTVTVTRAMMAEQVTSGPGTYAPANVQAVSWEVYPVRPQLTTYILPFGENLGAGFERVHTLIQATENSTTVQVDFNADGVFDAVDLNRDGDCADATDARAANGFKVTLNQGEAMLVNRLSDGEGGAGCTAPNSGLNTGTVIEGSSTLQVQYTVGDPLAGAANDWEIRNYSAFPRGLWDDEYYAPVPGMTNGAGTDIYLHNAWNTPLTVNYEHRFGSGSIAIPANSTVSYYTATGNTEVPNGTAVHLKSTDGRVFWGVSVADRNAPNYNWSYSLVPAYLLTSQYYIGWAPSNSSLPPTGGDVNSNGIYLTPAQDNTLVFVDYDRNGTVDSTYTLNRLQTIFLCDVDNDALCNTAGNTAPQNDANMSGAAIWATGPFIAAYGQNADNATAGGGFDLGYTTLPDGDWIDFVIDVTKSTNPGVHGTGTGQIATYTTVVTTSEFLAENVSIIDVLATGWGYCTGTNAPVAGCLPPVVTFPDGSTSADAPRTFTIVDGYIDLDMDGVPNEVNGNDDGRVGGILVDNGLLDMSGNGTAGEAGDDGVFNGIPVIDGRVDVDRGGTLTTADDDPLVRLSWDQSTWTGGQLDMAPNQELRIAYSIHTTAAHAAGLLTTSPVTAYGSRIIGLPAIAQTFNASDRVANLYTDNNLTIEKWSKTAGNCGADAGNDVDTLYPGDSFCYRVKVTNTGTGTLTRIGVFDTLPAGVTYTAASASNSRSTVADDFTTAAYTNNAGTRTWGGNWVETGDTGGATADDILITAAGELQLNNDDALASSVLDRQVDLLGATSALLSFKWRTSAGVDAADSIRLCARASNVAAWDCTITGGVFTGTGGVQAGTYSVDLAAEGLGALTATAQIRFDFSANTYYTDIAANESFYVDDLSITSDISDTNGGPPNLIPGNYLYALLPGQSLAVSFNATVDDPLVTGTTELTNTAAATSAQITIPIVASVTDPVVIPSSQSGSVGDRVWMDTDADGVLDVGESGIAGVTVELKDQYGTTLLTTTTDGQGRYLFTGVSFGSGYYAEVTAGLPVGLTQTTDGRTDNRTNAFGLITAGDYRDNFAAATYVNSNGSLDWTTDVWVESDLTGGGAAGGEIQITGGELRINGDTGGTTNAIRRSVNIPDGAASATLTFDWRTATVEAVDSIVVQVAADGGTTFTTLATYTGYTGTASGSANIDLTPYLSTDTRIRFAVSAGYAEADDYFFVDNFRVQYSGFTDYLSADLGYQPAGGTAVIGDRVWSDADGDGVQDAGEPGFGGVEIRLYPDTTGDGVPDNTTITVIDGALDLDGDGAITSADTGRAGNRSIVSGRADINGDGVITSGTSDDGTITVGVTTYNVYDGGIDFNGSGTVTTADDGTTPVGSNYRTATTAADGSYLFSAIATGTQDYIASIDASQPALSGYNLTTAANFGFANVSDGGIYLNGDFGAVQQAAGTTYAIKDRVWLDGNANGVQDGVETGIAGVTVDLLDGGGATIATAMTDVSGNFTFTGVPKDVRYRWVITDQNTVLTDYTPITAAALAGEFQMPNTLDEADDLADGTNDDVVEYNDPSNPVGYRPNFGYNIARSIGDTVFNDLNGDGDQDAGETGLSGVAVKLYNDTDADGVVDAGVDVVQATLTTDANGTYLFSGLGNGTFIVSIESPPAGYLYVQPGQPADSDGVTTGQQRAAGIVLGVSDLDNDFGYQASSPRTVSGTVWSDADQLKDIDAAETKLSGVTVELYKDTDGNGTIDAGEPLLGTATTDAGGLYTFSGIQGSGAATDDYIVSVTDAGGVLSGYTTTYEGPNADGTGDDGVYNGTQIISNLNGDVTRNYGYFKAQPTYAAIASFLAYVADGAVTVEWRTALESGTVGFHLQRLDPESGAWVQVNERLLPGLVVHPEGGTYRYRDAAADAGAGLTYVLVEVDNRGERRSYGPYSVQPEIGARGGDDGPGTAQPHTPYERQPRSQPAQLFAAAAGEAVSAGEAFTFAPGVAKITTRGAGLQVVTADQLAPYLGLPANAVANLVMTQKVAVIRGGKVVPYLYASGGTVIYFLAEPVGSPYTDENVYWIKAANGKTMAQRAAARPGPVAASYPETLHVELDRYPLPLIFTDPMSDFWCWEYLFAGYDGIDALTVNVPASGVAGTGPGTLTVRVVGGTDGPAAVDHHVLVTWNNKPLGTANWGGIGPHEIVLPVDPAEILEGDNALGVTALLDEGSAASIVYFDSADLTYDRRYRVVDDRLAFSAPGGAAVTLSGFVAAPVVLLDVTNPAQPVRITGAVKRQAGDGTFELTFGTGAGTRRYLAQSVPGALAPVRIEGRRNQGLRKSTNRADYLLIAPDGLVAAARSLASYRAATGLRTLVVGLGAIRDEFGDGIATPAAVREFIRYATTFWVVPPGSVVLIGNGTYDYKNTLGGGDNLNPPLLAGTPYGLVASDNLLADLVGDDGVPEVAIGRLPVLTSQELLDYVAKIQAQEGAPAGPWKTRYLFTADPPDASGAFPDDSDAVADLIPDGSTVAKVKVHLDSISLAGGKAEVVDRLNEGVALFNFIGHGGLNRISGQGDGLFTNASVPFLANAGRLPLFLAMTCSAANFAMPSYPSLGEALLLARDGGAFAVWGPAGLSDNAGAVLLNKAFIAAAIAGGGKPIGELVRTALRSLDEAPSLTHVRYIYNILGEPVSRLP